jgi:hypothetical protein
MMEFDVELTAGQLQSTVAESTVAESTVESVVACSAVSAVW